jgi:hypothetical protein
VLQSSELAGADFAQVTPPLTHVPPAAVQAVPVAEDEEHAASKNMPTPRRETIRMYGVQHDACPFSFLAKHRFAIARALTLRS